MGNRTRNTIITFLLTSLVGGTQLGCAGPTTPLGAPWATEPEQLRSGPIAFIASLFQGGSTEIRFEPGRQVLHGPSPMRIVIDDHVGVKSNYKLVVRHNGIDVTPSFLRQANINVEPKRITIELPVVRLAPTRDHLIEVIYHSGALGRSAYARYEPPVCDLRAADSIRSTEGFKASQQLLTQIRDISKSHRINPAFTAGLIAQESSFNPNTVSWAKAIGLTQVTPVAEHEIVSRYEKWPRYPGINELPAVFVKALVASGHANESNEWRLNTGLSIRGGLTYADQLASRWATPENFSRIKQLFPDADAELTRLVLASYNSGFTRVSTALSRQGGTWLSAPELKEARNYVGRISSLCYHFKEEDPK